MKAHATCFDTRRRPPVWSALLSVFVALSLILSPTQMCALMEMVPGHAHGEGHSHEAASAHEHFDDEGAPEAVPHGDHSRAVAPYHATNGATLQPVPQAHECCSIMNEPPVVVAAVSRLAAPDTHSAPATFAPAVSPSPHDTFAVTNCHGRDGPLDETLHSQLRRATLLGRAPPVSV